MTSGSTAGPVVCAVSAMLGPPCFALCSPPACGLPAGESQEGAGLSPWGMVQTGRVADGVTIGEFSGITHLSIKTLRRYHEAGLLEPAHVDPRTGYRYYSL